MARAPWRAELLDKWRMLGDDLSDPTLHRDRGVDSFIARFVRSINEFVCAEVAPDHQIQWRDPRTGALTNSRETYGDIAVQAILYKLFSDRGVPQKLPAIMRFHFEIESRYDDETNRALGVFFLNEAEMLNRGILDYFGTELKPDFPVDYALLKTGQEFYARYSIEIGMALLCASLPICYCNSRGVRALTRTHALTRGTAVRIIETTRFVLGVMQPGALEQWTGSGVRTARKIRLLHAYNRYRLVTHGDTETRDFDGDYLAVPKEIWDTAELGVPLNQEDMAMTLMAFSVTILDSLRKMGVDIHTDTEEAYFHTWRYVGFLIGIPSELIPDTVADGRELLKTIADRQFHPLIENGKVAPDGKQINDALIAFVQDAFRRIGRDRLVGWPATKMRYLLGKEYADLLSVPPADGTRILIPTIRTLHLVERVLMHGAPVFRRRTAAMSRLVFMGLAMATHPDGRPMFGIPGDK